MGHDPLRPHTHDPNPEPPSADPALTLSLPDGSAQRISVADLRSLPATTIPNCYIVSTGHGTSGPFTFTGARLADLLQAYLPPGTAYTDIEVVSADGFGNRVLAAEVQNPAEIFLLSYQRDGQPLTRQEGLVRLIVPGETDDALRQVKWIGRINVR